MVYCHDLDLVDAHRTLRQRYSTIPVLVEFFPDGLDLDAPLLGLPSGELDRSLRC